MATTDAPLPQVAVDLQNAHSKPEMAHVFQEFADLSKGSHDELKQALRQMYGHVKLPSELKLDGFQVVGFDSKQGALLLAGANKTAAAIDAQGEVFKPDASGQKFKMVAGSGLPDTAPVAAAADTGAAARRPQGAATDTSGQPQPQPHAAAGDAGQTATGQPHTQAFGNRGRQMDVSADGKTGVFHIGNDKDSLWAVSADLLGKDNKHLSKQDILDIQAKIDELAKDPRNHITDPNRIIKGHDLFINVPHQDAPPPPAKETQPPPPPAKDTQPPPPPAKDTQPPPPAEQTANKPGLDPSRPNDNLKPTADGVYNPLAPKGLIEGEPTKPLTESTGGVHEREVTGTENDDRTGNVTRHYKGHLADGFLWGHRTKFHADETVDKQGGLISRDVDYTGGATFTLPNQAGEPTSVNVQKIHTERQADGSYKTTVTDTSGNSFDVISDADGHQLSAVPPSPSMG